MDAKVDGKRRALTSFHSFRRWFITEAERAGAPPHVIKRPGMTLGVYSGGPDLEAQMRKVVEAVKLPGGCAIRRVRDQGVWYTRVVLFQTCTG